jgi:hypothetical protein
MIAAELNPWLCRCFRSPCKRKLEHVDAGWRVLILFSFFGVQGGPQRPFVGDLQSENHRKNILGQERERLAE